MATKNKTASDLVLSVFVWLIAMPSFCALAWYCIYKLVMWSLYG